MKKQLLIGAGSRHLKLVDPTFEQNMKWEKLTTLDYNPDHNPDVVHDLNSHPLPFEDNTFDEIHAYEILEHLGGIGDYRFLFAEFTEYWRILKPGGYFCATVPAKESVWALGDPSHTRIFCPEWLVFLQQAEYQKQIGYTPMSDFRNIYQADFSVVAAHGTHETFFFALQAIK